MLKMKRMRFPKEIILVCIRWYAAYALSYRNLEEMMQERGVSVDHWGRLRKRKKSYAKDLEATVAA